MLVRFGLVQGLAWSPDGKRIAFSGCDRTENCGIYVLALRGRRVTRVTRRQSRREIGEVAFWSPAWSSDAKQIAATKEDVVAEKATLVVASARGGGERSLGRGSDPLWISRSEIAVALLEPGTGRTKGIRFVRTDRGAGRRLNSPGDQLMFAWAKRARRLVLAAETTRGIRFYSVDPKRGGARPLTRGLGAVRGHPAWSADGTRLAVTRDLRQEHVSESVFVIDVVGVRGNSTRILRPAADTQLSASPDGHRVVFSRRVDQRNEIVTMNTDGSLPRRLAFGTEPIWSPSGEKIAFERNGALYSMNTDGSAQLQLATGSQPSFSPDGRFLAYTRDAIYSVGATGGPERRLTGELCPNPERWYAAEPAWSPDGARIAFTVVDCGPDEVFLMRSDGSNAHRIAEGSLPLWSPAGDRLAFIGYPSNKISTMRPDGSERNDLVSGRGAAWSPDGRRIAFVRGQQGRFGQQIRVINLDGSGERRVAADAAMPEEQLRPVWLR